MSVVRVSGLTRSSTRLDETTTVRGLAVISQHAALRGDCSGPLHDPLHPQLFPIDQMFRLLIDLVGECSATD